MPHEQELKEPFFLISALLPNTFFSVGAVIRLPPSAPGMSTNKCRRGGSATVEPRLHTVEPRDYDDVHLIQFFPHWMCVILARPTRCFANVSARWRVVKWCNLFFFHPRMLLLPTPTKLKKEVILITWFYFYSHSKNVPVPPNYLAVRPVIAEWLQKKYWHVQYCFVIFITLSRWMLSRQTSPLCYRYVHFL